MSLSLSLDDEPSFDLGRAQTSTPNKARDLRTRYPTQRGEIGDAEPLYDSDTDSIAGDAHEPQIAYTGDNEVRDGRSTPLTRRSLLQLAQNVDSVDPLPVPRAAPLAPLSVDPHSGLHDRRTLEALRREHLYAPSPSTGSSTLVDRDHEPLLASSKTRYSGLQDVPTLRDSSPRLTGSTGPPPRPRIEGIFERDGGPSEDESVASQQLRRSRIGDLASFVDSRLTRREEQHSQSTTPRRRQSLRVSASERSREFVPAAAPVPPVSTPRLSASARYSTPNGRGEPETESPNSVGSTQVHDVFKRLITGPDGALAHSAARRAAAAATTAAFSSASLSASYNRYVEQQPPSTPAPPGHSTFVPSSSLPVQREVPRRSPQERTYPPQGTLRSDVQEYQEAHHQEGPSQLERALQHLSEAQRDSESHQGAHANPREAVGRTAHGAVELTRSTPTLPEGRSAIDFAMAESSAFSHSEDDDEVAAARDPHATLRNSVRFAAEPTYRDQSPSRSLSPPPLSRTPSPPPPSASFANQSTFAGPGAFPRSASPDLPPLPLPLPPESPEAARVAAPKTRSPPSRFRRSRASPPPEEPHLSPPRYDPVSPSRPNRRPGWERPASSTPPRREGVEPPRPRGTPEHRPDLSLSRTARASSSSTSPPPTWQDHHAEEQPSLIEPLRFEPPPPQRPRPEEENESYGPADESSTSVKIKELVSQLSAAVQTLAEREPQVLPSPPPDDRLELIQAEGKDEPPLPTRLGPELERRRQASDQRRQSLDAELDGIDARTAANQNHRSEMMHQLVETYELEHELGTRMEELKRSIEGIGQLVGDQVSEAVGQTLQRESQHRARWFAIACGAQIAIFLFILRLVNAQHANMYASVYYDPFHPDLFHLPPGSSPYDFRHDPYLSLDTLSAFAPPGTIRSGPSSTFGVSLLAVKAVLRRWILPLLPKLRLSSNSVEQTPIVPI